jgi:hypothetical protein
MYSTLRNKNAKTNRMQRWGKKGNILNWVLMAGEKGNCCFVLAFQTHVFWPYSSIHVFCPMY